MSVVPYTRLRIRSKWEMSISVWKKSSFEHLWQLQIYLSHRYINRTRDFLLHRETKLFASLTDLRVTRLQLVFNQSLLYSAAFRANVCRVDQLGYHLRKAEEIFISIDFCRNVNMYESKIEGKGRSTENRRRVLYRRVNPCPRFERIRVSSCVYHRRIYVSTKWKLLEHETLSLRIDRSMLWRNGPKAVNSVNDSFDYHWWSFCRVDTPFSILQNFSVYLSLNLFSNTQIETQGISIHPTEIKSTHPTCG